MRVSYCDIMIAAYITYSFLAGNVSCKSLILKPTNGVALSAQEVDIQVFGAGGPVFDP